MLIDSVAVLIIHQCLPISLKVKQSTTF